MSESQLLTRRLLVRVLFGEPNNPTTNYLSFWLTARRHGLAGNGQYGGNPALSSLPGLPVGLPKSPLPGLSGCASQSLRRGVRVWLTGFRFGTRRAIAIELTGQIHVDFH